VLKGVTTMVKVAHLRLCHSRMPFVRGVSAREPGDGVRRPFGWPWPSADLRCNERAFAFFKGPAASDEPAQRRHAVRPEASSSDSRPASQSKSTRRNSGRAPNVRAPITPAARIRPF
jgi:hypothetical protein